MAEMSKSLVSQPACATWTGVGKMKAERPLLLATTCHEYKTKAIRKTGGNISRTQRDGLLNFISNCWLPSTFRYPMLCQTRFDAS
jgi:hypothetical protein